MDSLVRMTSAISYIDRSPVESRHLAMTMAAADGHAKISEFQLEMGKVEECSNFYSITCESRPSRIQ
jgi:ankyrin repeat protein